MEFEENSIIQYPYGCSASHSTISLCFCDRGIKYGAITPERFEVDTRKEEMAEFDYELEDDEQDTEEKLRKRNNVHVVT